MPAKSKRNVPHIKVKGANCCGIFYSSGAVHFATSIWWKVSPLSQVRFICKVETSTGQRNGDAGNSWSFRDQAAEALGIGTKNITCKHLLAA